MKFYECGICGAYHRWEWHGDCREDAERLADVPADAEVFSMEDRVAADRARRYQIVLREWDSHTQSRPVLFILRGGRTYTLTGASRIVARANKAEKLTYAGFGSYYDFREVPR